MQQHKLRVLVVDDAVDYRRVLSDFIESLDDTELVGTSPRGTLALGKLAQTTVDLVLLDAEMPEKSGLDTLREIRRLHGTTSVIMLGDAPPPDDVQQLDVLGYLHKPASLATGRTEMLTKIKRLMQQAHIRRNLRGPESTPAKVETPVPKPPPTQPARFTRPGRIDVVLIGISTGGPEALMQLIPNLPADLGVPVLVVQHMPPLFTASLAQDLDRRSRLTVKEAVQGEAIHPNVVLIAPGGHHMTVRSRPDLIHGTQELLIGFDDGPPENSCRPSVDVLFRSAARHYAGRAMAVVMTGMGSDGCEGMRDLKRAGCLSITQSEKTCVVYGMPLAIDEAGLSDEQVPLPMLASRITRAVMGDRA